MTNERKITLENGEIVNISQESYDALAKAVAKKYAPVNIISKYSEYSSSVYILSDKGKNIRITHGGNISITNDTLHALTKCELELVDGNKLVEGDVFIVKDDDQDEICNWKILTNSNHRATIWISMNGFITAKCNEIYYHLQYWRVIK